jgi:dephospho-CoA kinase
MTYRVGLTGGIGCGKSTVGKMFANLGVTLIDTDTISHALTQPGAIGLREIRRQFDSEFFLADGTLDRAKLRTKIFSDAAAKLKLEAILHPLIYAEVENILCQPHAHYVIIVVPLLFETKNYLPLIQRRLVVDCCEATQIARSMARSQLPEQAVRAIMDKQLVREERLQQADDVICNEDEALDTLHAQVLALHLDYLARAREACA